MIASSSKIDVRMPRQRVFDYVTDPKNMPRWQSNLLRAEAQPGLPIGSRIHMSVLVVGQTTEVNMEVLDNDGVGYLKLRSVRGPVQFDMTHYFREISEGQTQIVIDVQINAGTVFKLAEPALQSITQTLVEADLKLLKAQLELN